MDKQTFINTMRETIYRKSAFLSIVNILLDKARAWDGKVITDNFTKEMNDALLASGCEGSIVLHNPPSYPMMRSIEMILPRFGVVSEFIKPTTYKDNFICDDATSVFYYGAFANLCYFLQYEYEKKIAEMEDAIQNIDSYILRYVMAHQEFNRIVKSLPYCLREQINKRGELFPA